jgi:hypothetical protein
METRSKPFDDADLLTKFEQEILQEPYKGYYTAKRNNFFASVDGFKDLWDCFMLSNTIWMREFEDMRTVIDTGKMFPLTLFMNGHSKMLIAMELGFSGCLTEAHSILRDAVESVAHGHRLFSDPALQRIWLQKNDGGTAIEDFKREFWYSKEDKLFDGVPDLLKLWKRFSDIGAHTNIDSIVSRFAIKQTHKHVTWRLNYTCVELRVLIPALFEMLLAYHVMEQVLYKDCVSQVSQRAEYKFFTLVCVIENISELVGRDVSAVIFAPKHIITQPDDFIVQIGGADYSRIPGIFHLSSPETRTAIDMHPMTPYRAFFGRELRCLAAAAYTQPLNVIVRIYDQFGLAQATSFSVAVPSLGAISSQELYSPRSSSIFPFE